jgi:protein archease
MAKMDPRNVPSSVPGPAESERSIAGHRLLAHTADSIIEAWGPDRVSCLVQALLGLVESFAEVPDVPATRLMPFAVAPQGPEDTLVSLFEDVIYALDVFSVVPVRFHLAETEGGGIAGDMEVVPADDVEVVGPVPKAVSYHELSMAPVKGGWQCRVLIDV